MEELIRAITPVRLELVWGTITGLSGTMATFLFGEWNNALQALAMFMLIDYITGVLAAYMRPKAKLSSKRGIRGIAKKLTLISLIVAAHQLDLALGQNVFCLLLTYFMLGNEGLSIIENAAYCGLPIPASLREKLEQLAQEKQEAKQGVKDVGKAKDTAKKHI
jgi:toxin secretion/phage lysis holin